jgi:S-formylglutathione hydrolase FrmB
VRIYFDCGQQDDYGFDAGASALHRLLERRGVPHEFHLYPGRHDWGYFISHLPQSMEFHSRAFGLTQK